MITEDYVSHIRTNDKMTTMVQHEFIDLGLPSGTLWAEENEEGYYTFDKAKEQFGDSVPSKELWDELREVCEWKWDDEKKGYTIIGKNGNCIFLPAAGYRNITNELNYVGSYGDYWSSSLYTGDPSGAWDVRFGSNGVSRYGYYRYGGFSVRLVSKPLEKVIEEMCKPDEVSEKNMKKIPFDIKYRPEIESGKYKVVTAEGRPVRIICWDKREYGGNKTLIALIPANTGTECIYQYFIEGIPTFNASPDKWALQIETEEPEWTEFEKEFDNALRSYRCEDFKGDYFQWVRMRAKKLMEIVKAQQ